MVFVQVIVFCRSLHTLPFINVTATLTSWIKSGCYVSCVFVQVSVCAFARTDHLSVFQVVGVPICAHQPLAQMHRWSVCTNAKMDFNFIDLCHMNVRHIHISVH